MKLSSTALLALAISSITATAYAETQSQDFVPTTLAGTSAQSEAKGFIEDFNLGGTTRNWYSHESKYRGGTFEYKKHGETRTDRKFQLGTGHHPQRQLGFHPGYRGRQDRIGGLQRTGPGPQQALKTSRAAQPCPGRLQRRAVDQWSKLGLANVQFRVANTTLTAGRQNFSSGIVDTIGNRALPSSFEGVSFNSEEFSNLSFQGGVRPRFATYRTEPVEIPQ